VLTTWLNSLVMLGLPGSFLGLGAVAYCLYWAFRAFRRLIAEARAAGARMIRIVLGSLALIAAAGILLLGIHIPYQVRAGYVYDNGAVRLTLTAGGDPAAVQPGRTVVLESGGIALRHTLGTATVTGATGSPGRVSIQTLVPLRSDGLTIPATEYPLAGLHADHLDSAGPAVIEISDVPLGTWLVQTYVAPELRAIFP
jgi:putative peptide zinc metalloprotease protein